jgi:uncharacterized caspase-like protein
LVAPENVDFHRTRNKTSGFLVSTDGQSIGLETAPGQWMRASPLRTDPATVLARGSASDRDLHAARRSGAVTVLTATGLTSHREPTKVNGQLVSLNLEEGVRSWAVHSGLPLAALGTQWRIHLLDDRARPMPGWEDPPFLPAPAYHTVITDDGRWVVVAVGDGTVHWYEVASGRERLRLFLHSNGVDWVASRPDGYYASSPLGDQFVGWLVNRGETQSPDLFRAVEFERELYRPDLISVALQQTSREDRSASQLARTLSELAPPRVSIESIQATADANTLAIRFTAESTGRPILELGVFVDGIPVLRAPDRLVSSADSRRLTRTVQARVTSGSSRVRVEAETARSLGIDESLPLKPPPLVQDARRGKLWIVAAGVHRFDQLSGLRPLPYATNDARELSRALATQSGKVFTDVRVAVLNEETSNKPTKRNILASLRDLEQMQAEDTAVIFLASHGAADASDYYFLTKDAEPSDVQKVILAQTSKVPLAVGDVPSLLSGSELTAALRRVPGRRILLLDTCRAGAIGSSDPYSLIKRSASAQLAVLSAARGDESSYDSPTQPHGAFTFGIIRALTGRANVPAGPVTLRAVFDAALPEVQDVVKELRGKASNASTRERIRQTPVIAAPYALESTVIAFH